MYLTVSQLQLQSIVLQIVIEVSVRYACRTSSGYRLCASASVLDFQFLCYNMQLRCYLYMYAADGIPGSASVGLLRLARQMCAVQNTNNCSACAVLC